ncbi:MAG: nucleotide sugar dehydrogenase, partial [Ilumatobacteraceae bacterium]
MKVCVVGMWHLGTVTAACLAAMGHEVIGFDPDLETISGLQVGRPAVYEPGLAELVQEQSTGGRLTFSSQAGEALARCEVVWIAYDTPVDDDDVADVGLVVERVHELFPHLSSHAVVLVSSQLVAGCTRGLQDAYDSAHPGTAVAFGYSPENLRLGKAIEAFTQPDRIVIGINGQRARSVVSELFGDLSDRILWMSVESAEMTKHALNAFLAMCVSFANEIAAICEQVGADAKEVEKGLKTEKRIGPAAYLSPGAAFAGGTLARDVQYLKLLSEDHNLLSPLLSSIKESNDLHRGWERRKLVDRFPSLSGVRVAVLGLTYKPGTDTLRRSTSVELCSWLVEQGAVVVAHDPRVRALPPELTDVMRLESSIADVLSG